MLATDTLPLRQPVASDEHGQPEVVVYASGTAIVAVMSTEAAATLMETNDASTPAAAAMLCCRPEVSA